MSATVSYPHIVKANGEPARLERHPRIRIAQIAMDYLAYGWSADEICRQHPYLQPAEVHAAMAYYYDHQPEIDAEIAAELAQVDEDERSKPRPPIYFKLKAQGLFTSSQALMR